MRPRPRRATPLTIAVAAALWAPHARAADEVHRLSFEQLAQAAQHGSRARAARLATAAARGRESEARGARFPKLALTGLVAPSPEIECLDPDCVRTRPDDVTFRLAGLFGSLELRLTQPLYTFGKLDAAGGAAAAATRASARLEDALAGDVAVEAARAYFGLKLARELGWMLEDGKAEIGKALARIDEKIAAGSSDVTVQDRLRIRTLGAEVDARLTEARQAEAVALAGVRLLAGDEQVDVDEAELAPLELALGANAGDYVARARSGRPELQAARAGVAALSELAALESARWWPDLALVGTAKVARAQGVDNPPSAFAYDPFNTAIVGVGLVLQWNLDPLAQKGRVDRARAEAGRAEELAAAAADGVELEVRQAHVEAAQARERLAAAREGEKSARGWLASVLQADVVGTSESKDFADAYIAYFTMRSRVLAAIFDWNVATVRLRRAVGEFAAAR